MNGRFQPIPAEVRLSRHIDKSGANGCWMWTGSLNRAGYGQAWGDRGQRLAHRAVYELHNGPIPDGLTIDHLCRVKSCVNPAHLEAVPLVENIRRAAGYISRPVRTECPKGHPLDDQSAYILGNKRICRVCRQANQRALRARKKDANHGQ